VKCGFCGTEVDPAKAFGGACHACVTKGERIGHLTDEQKKNLRRAVEAETSGLFSPDLLHDVLEGMYDKIMEGSEPFDSVIRDTANEIQRLGGLGMCREMLRIASALGELERDISEEIRRKARVLSGREKE